MSEIQKALDCLNEAMRLDPLAMRAMLINIVPCNAGLANHESIQVHALADGYMVGMLGVINGVLASMGLPLIASQWSSDKDENGSHTLVGFMEYRPKVNLE